MTKEGNRSIFLIEIASPLFNYILKFSIVTECLFFLSFTDNSQEMSPGFSESTLGTTALQKINFTLSAN